MRSYLSRLVIAGVLAISGSIIGGALAPVPLEASRPSCEQDECDFGIFYDSCVNTGSLVSCDSGGLSCDTWGCY